MADFRIFSLAENAVWTGKRRICDTLRYADSKSRVSSFGERRLFTTSAIDAS